MKTIELIIKDREGYTADSIDFFATIKEAKAWVKEAGLRADYWDRRAESKGASRYIHSIELHVNGELHTEWETNFATQTQQTKNSKTS